MCNAIVNLSVHASVSARAFYSSGIELTVALLAHVTILNLNFEDLPLSFITDILMAFLFVFPCRNKKNIIMH